MRYTKIEIEGEAGLFASVTRKRLSGVIEVEVVAPTGTRAMTCKAGDDEDRWALAQRLQAELDGQRGCGGDIRDYAAVLERFAD